MTLQKPESRALLYLQVKEREPCSVPQRPTRKPAQLESKKSWDGCCWETLGIPGWTLLGGLLTKLVTFSSLWSVHLPLHPFSCYLKVTVGAINTIVLVFMASWVVGSGMGGDRESRTLESDRLAFISQLLQDLPCVYP